jgi:hypothetical protein
MIQRAVSCVTSLGFLSFCAFAHAQSYAGPDPARLEAQVAGMKAMVSRWEVLGPGS